MWKSGKKQDRTSSFFPQPIVENFEVFHRGFFEGFPGKVSTVYFSTFHRGCGKRYEILDMRYKIGKTRVSLCVKETNWNLAARPELTIEN